MAVSIDGIRQAAKVVDPVFLNSPHFRCEGLSEALGLDLICKVESMNPVGCFKGRGMDYWLHERPDAQKVVCASAGNLGQALAYSCRKRGVALCVVVPVNANTAKVRALRRLNAEVVEAGHDFDEAKDIAFELSRSGDYTYVEDGKEPQITEGLGTLGLELVARQDSPHAVYLPVGNGALISGAGLAIKEAYPACEIVGVCAAGAPSMKLSWDAGKVVCTERVNTIADGLAVRTPVEAAVLGLRAVVDRFVMVEDAAIEQAMGAYFEHQRIVAEPSGAVTLAAVTGDKDALEGRRIAVVMSGSNLGPEHVHALGR